MIHSAMTTTATNRNDLLNKMADFASSKGVDVTSTEGRNTVRSLAVNILVEEFGVDAEKAFNLIWGDNSFDELKNTVARELSARYKAK